MNPNRIEVIELPSGKFSWLIRAAAGMVYSSVVEHESELGAELDARLFPTKNHPGVVFVVEHRYPQALRVALGTGRSLRELRRWHVDFRRARKQRRESHNVLSTAPRKLVIS